MKQLWPTLKVGQTCFQGPMNEDTPGNKGPMNGWGLGVPGAPEGGVGAVLGYQLVVAA